MQQAGNLLNRSEIKSFESGFQVQEFYMDCKTFNQDSGQEYPNILKFQLIGEKINLLNSFNRGDRIIVSYNVKGKEYPKDDGTKGHIQNLNVWKIEKVQNAGNYQQQPTYQNQQPTNNPADEDDDLPF